MSTEQPPLKKPLVLASASPHRAELLRQVGISCEVVPPDLTEEQPPVGSSQQQAEQLALAKARQVFRRRPEAAARCACSRAASIA